jgi:tripartite ATP-independent transporter DctP family solute receptor
MSSAAVCKQFAVPAVVRATVVPPLRFMAPALLGLADTSIREEKIMRSWIYSLRQQALMLALSVSSVVAFAQSTTAPATRTLRMSITLSAESPQGKAAYDFAKRVSQYTDGRIRVDVYPEGKLGDDASMLKEVRAGTVDFMCPEGSIIGSVAKEFSAISYPFTFLSEAEADAVLDGQWGTGLFSKLPSQGLVGLAFWENGFRQLTNSRRPISSSADFAGLKLRVMQNPMLVQSFNRLGFQAEPMPFSRVYDALKNQTVDGQENPLPTILTSRFHEVQKHLTLSRHAYSALVLVASSKSWDSLSPRDREAIQRSASESKAYQRSLNRELNAKALAELKAKGMLVSELPREDADRIRYRLRDVFDKYNAEIGVKTMVDLYVELGRLRTTSR